MMSDKARELFEAGAIRESITRYRHSLRYETDTFKRAGIYLDLVRIYRIRVRMKNAQLELRRAFQELLIPWPDNNVFSVLQSILMQNRPLARHPDFERQPLDAKTQMLTELFEEVALSAYYLRQNWTLVQATFRSKKSCQDLGPSRALLNWYGGSACIFALVDLTLYRLIPGRPVNLFRKRCDRYMQRTHEIAAKLDPHTGPGKALIWEALICEYRGDPVRSANLFETCLNDHGRHLDPYDIRLSAITLSLNYLTRGHFRKSLDALKKQVQCNPTLRESPEGSDAIAWYALGAQAMLGELSDIQNPVRLFKSILSVDKDEKWLLAQYLGHLLIAGRQTGLPCAEVEDLIRRFDVLGMSPRATHVETGFFWVAKAYARYSFALQDRSLLPHFKSSLKQLEQVLPHPTAQSHYAVLRAGLAHLENKEAAYAYWFNRALLEARRIDNRWALIELAHLQRRAQPKGLAGDHLEIK